MKKLISILFFAYIFAEVGLYRTESISVTQGVIQSYIYDTRNGDIYSIVNRKKKKKVCNSNLSSKSSYPLST